MKICVWWKIPNLFMSTAQMIDTGLMDHIIKHPQRGGGVVGQLRLWI